MKTVIAISLLFAFAGCLTPDQAMVSEYGKINREKIVKGVKVKTGLWVEAVDSGNVQMAIYRNGLKQGLVKTVYRNGGYVITHYKDDVKDGKSTTYWNDGIAYRVDTYAAGKLVSTVDLNGGSK
ncbi:MAG TPA: hypothetical protein VHE54_17355 [Puia sp.]|nr:hypothetical protein [Puia sp.]